jgi:hypothetical protein
MPDQTQTQEQPPAPASLADWTYPRLPQPADIAAMAGGGGGGGGGASTTAQLTPANPATESVIASAGSQADINQQNVAQIVGKANLRGGNSFGETQEVRLHGMSAPANPNVKINPDGIILTHSSGMGNVLIDGSKVQTNGPTSTWTLETGALRYAGQAGEFSLGAGGGGRLIFSNYEKSGERVIIQSDLDERLGPRKLTMGQNLDNIRTPGTYICDDGNVAVTLQNLPPGQGGYFTLIVEAGPYSGCHQTFIREFPTSLLIFTRTSSVTGEFHVGWPGYPDQGAGNWRRDALFRFNPYTIGWWPTDGSEISFGDGTFGRRWKSPDGVNLNITGAHSEELVVDNGSHDPYIWNAEWNIISWGGYLIKGQYMGAPHFPLPNGRAAYLENYRGSGVFGSLTLRMQPPAETGGMSPYWSAYEIWATYWKPPGTYGEP